MPFNFDTRHMVWCFSYDLIIKLVKNNFVTLVIMIFGIIMIIIFYLCLKSNRMQTCHVYIILNIVKHYTYMYIKFKNLNT